MLESDGDHLSTHGFTKATCNLAHAECQESRYAKGPSNQCAPKYWTDNSFQFVDK